MSEQTPTSPPSPQPRPSETDPAFAKAFEKFSDDGSVTEKNLKQLAVGQVIYAVTETAMGMGVRVEMARVKITEIQTTKDFPHDQVVLYLSTDDEEAFFLGTFDVRAFNVYTTSYNYMDSFQKLFITEADAKRYLDNINYIEQVQIDILKGSFKRRGGSFGDFFGAKP